MKSGVIASVHGTGDLNDFYETVEPQAEEFNQLEQCVQITEEISLSNGKVARLGRAAIEDLSDVEDVRISDGVIRQYERPEKITLYTDFLFVPDSFVAIASSSGTFAFDLIEQNASVSVEQIEFDLEGYTEQNPDAGPWKVGFYDRIGNAENGVMHGEQLLNDSEIGSVLGTSKKNQVGLEYNHDGHLLKTFVTRSGYVEVYQPSNYSSSDFVGFIESELLPHATPK